MIATLLLYYFHKKLSTATKNKEYMFKQKIKLFCKHTSMPNLWEDFQKELRFHR